MCRALACVVSVIALLASTPAAAAPRTVELVLDASGSMNARLPSGETRLAAAKEAVARLVPGLAPGTAVAFRAYGHQSPRERHDCDDTELLVPFGAAGSVGAEIAARARGLSARGYTPISRVLRLAAQDLAGQTPGERVILLVSDGKETCDADPCATARALKEADASLVVHAIGFEVDSGARGELECVAAATGGRYFDANGLEGLAAALGQAAVAPVGPVELMTGEPGNLEIKGADPQGHPVTDAATGAKVGEISSFKREIRVPPGIYNVGFHGALWRGVVVRPKAKTVLEPAILEIEGAARNGHDVVDSETGQKIFSLSAFTRSAAFLPGLYDVTFGKVLLWRHVRLDAGRKTVLRPGILAVAGASLNGHAVRDAEGREVARPSGFDSVVPLPPGRYAIDFAGKAVPFTLEEGQRLELTAPKG